MKTIVKGSESIPEIPPASLPSETVSVSTVNQAFVALDADSLDLNDPKVWEYICELDENISEKWEELSNVINRCFIEWVTDKDKLQKLLLITTNLCESKVFSHVLFHTHKTLGKSFCDEIYSYFGSAHYFYTQDAEEIDAFRNAFRALPLPDVSECLDSKNLLSDSQRCTVGQIYASVYRDTITAEQIWNLGFSLWDNDSGWALLNHFCTQKRMDEAADFALEAWSKSRDSRYASILAHYAGKHLHAESFLSTLPKLYLLSPSKFPIYLPWWYNNPLLSPKLFTVGAVEEHARAERNFDPKIVQKVNEQFYTEAKSMSIVYADQRIRALRLLQFWSLVGPTGESMDAYLTLHLDILNFWSDGLTELYKFYASNSYAIIESNLSTIIWEGSSSESTDSSDPRISMIAHILQVVDFCSWESDLAIISKAREILERMDDISAIPDDIEIIDALELIDKQDYRLRRSHTQLRCIPLEVQCKNDWLQATCLKLFWETTLRTLIQLYLATDILEMQEEVLSSLEAHSPERWDTSIEIQAQSSVVAEVNTLLNNILSESNEEEKTYLVLFLRIVLASYSEQNQFLITEPLLHPSTKYTPQYISWLLIIDTILKYGFLSADERDLILSKHIVNSVVSLKVSIEQCLLQRPLLKIDAIDISSEMSEYLKLIESFLKEIRLIDRSQFTPWEQGQIIYLEAILLWEIGTKVSVKKAIKLFEQSYKLGVHEAMIKLGNLLMNFGDYAKAKLILDAYIQWAISPLQELSGKWTPQGNFSDFCEALYALLQNAVECLNFSEIQKLREIADTYDIAWFDIQYLRYIGEWICFLELPKVVMRSVIFEEAISQLYWMPDHELADLWDSAISGLGLYAIMRLDSISDILEEFENKSPQLLTAGHLLQAHQEILKEEILLSSFLVTFAPDSYLLSIKPTEGASEWEEYDQFTYDILGALFESVIKYIGPADIKLRTEQLCFLQSLNGKIEDDAEYLGAWDLFENEGSLWLEDVKHRILLEKIAHEIAWLFILKLPELVNRDMQKNVWLGVTEYLEYWLYSPNASNLMITFWKENFEGEPYVITSTKDFIHAKQFAKCMQLPFKDAQITLH